MEQTLMPLNLMEYEEAAKLLLPPMVFDYIARGSGDEQTLNACREAFNRWSFVPRVLRGIERPDLCTTVLGSAIDLPVLLAPTAFQRLVHEDGERASARAARAAGTLFVLSTLSTCAMEQVVTEADRWWFQLYFLRDRGLTRNLVQRAETAGASAIVVTVDTPVQGKRETDQRNSFALPEGLTCANLTGTLYEKMFSPPEGSGLASYISDKFEASLKWSDLEWLASTTSLPIIPKGILHPEDARLAVEQGLPAVVVSNHGGRQLDSAIPSLDALPAIAEAVAGRAEILLDGGVRRGSDVLKALALGAKAVLIGRPYVWGLAVNGEAGARRVLDVLAKEIALDLILCGCGSLTEVDQALIVRSSGSEGG